MTKSVVEKVLSTLTLFSKKESLFYKNLIRILVEEKVCVRCCLRHVGKWEFSRNESISCPNENVTCPNESISCPNENVTCPDNDFHENVSFDLSQTHVELKKYYTRDTLKKRSSIGSLDGHEFRSKPNPYLPATTTNTTHDLDLDGEDAANTTTTTSSPTPAVPCPLCLGLLQTDFKRLSLHLFECFKSQNFKVAQNSFRLSIRLPFQLPIRQAGIDHHIYSTFNNKEEIDEEEKKQNLLLLKQTIVLDVKEVFKNLLKTSFSSASSLEFDGKSPLSLVLCLDHAETESDYKFLTTIPAAKFQVKKNHKRGKTYYQGASAEKISRAVKLVTPQDFMDAGQTPPPPITTFPTLVTHTTDAPPPLFFSHESVFIAGRYCKLQRHISNSAWMVAGKRMTVDSIEELIGAFLPGVFGNKAYKFSSAGREDSDVLMLNDGRPFYFEVLEPRNGCVGQVEMSALEDEINGGVEGKIRVYDLQVVTLQDTSILKNSAATKSKSYMCLVELENPVSLEKINAFSGTTNLQIAQRNPTRVPRRADMVRDKVIEQITLHPQDTLPDGTCKTIMANLQTSAGTYVKEFMHGDEGRTIPSLSSILECGSVTVKSLDVSKVFLEWPPRLTSHSAIAP